MSKRSNIRRFVLALLMLAAYLAAPATALAERGESYTLDQQARHLPVPQPYVFESLLSGDGQACGPLRDPRDVYVTADGTAYVADTRNRRIVVFGPDGKYLREFAADNQFRSPEGVFVTDNGHIWVADRGKQQIFHLDANGNVIAAIEKPESELLKDVSFTPTKLVVDKRGYIYVTVGGTYQGILVVDAIGNFRGFFGRINLPFDLGAFVKRLLATEQQKRRAQRTVPDPITSMVLDADGYVYGVVPSARTAQIRRLNSIGLNVYPENTYGEVIYTSRGRAIPSFIAIAANEYGIVSVLDATSGRIYQYDQDGKLLFVFGGMGEQLGLFVRPNGVFSGPNGRLYVLDTGNNRVQILRPTRFTELVHQASKLHYDGRYLEAAGVWRQVLELHNQYYLAHDGVGRALWKQGHWPEAMEQYFLALNRTGWSQVFIEWRQAMFRQNFGWVFLGVVVGSGGLALQGRLLAGPRRRLIQWARKLHEHQVRWTVPLLVGLAVVVRLATLMVMSFHYRVVEPEDANLLLEAGRVVGLWASWVIVSFGLSELFFGEGSMRAVMVDSAYALLPYILLAIPLTLLTHILALEERALYDALIIAMYAWVIINLFSQLLRVHDFGFKRSLLVFALILFGIVVLWAVVAMVYLLGRQIIQFISEIYFEVMY